MNCHNKSVLSYLPQTTMSGVFAIGGDTHSNSGLFLVM